MLHRSVGSARDVLREGDGTPWLVLGRLASGGVRSCAVEVPEGIAAAWLTLGRLAGAEVRGMPE